MIPYHGLCTAVIAIYQCLCILELCRHRLKLNRTVQVSECRLHIRDGLATYRATIRALRILGKTFMVNAVTTSHDNHGLRRSEHIITADRTITLSRPFNASMGSFNRYGQAHTACLFSIQHPIVISIRRKQSRLPCSERNLSLVLDLYDRCRSQCSDRYSSCCHYPRACRPHRSIVQLVLRSSHRNGQRVAHDHTSCTTCFPFYFE